MGGEGTSVGKWGWGRRGLVVGRQRSPGQALCFIPMVCRAFSLKSIPGYFLCHLTLFCLRTCARDLRANTGWTSRWVGNQSVERPKAGAGEWLNGAQGPAVDPWWAWALLHV